MTKKIATLIRQIVGRLKNNMYTAGMTFGLMLVPLGYYLLIEGSGGFVIVGYFSIPVGIIVFLIGWIMNVKEERDDKKNNQKRYDDLLTELRGLRRDMRRWRHQ